MAPNISCSGIRFGYISSNSLDGDVVDSLMFGFQAKNISYAEWEKEEILLNELAWDNQDPSAIDPNDFEVDNESYLSEEEIIEGVYEGVSYISSWLGGALHFFITDSIITGNYEECSPCVPNAGNLNQPSTSGVVTYDVPASWRTD